MIELENILEQRDSLSTVMIVCKSSEISDGLLSRLAEAGLNVIGPVDRAALALIVAGQTPADLAIIESELAGKRNGAELARCLEETWGIPSVMLGAA